MDDLLLAADGGAADAHADVDLGQVARAVVEAASADAETRGARAAARRRRSRARARVGGARCGGPSRRSSTTPSTMRAATVTVQVGLVGHRVQVRVTDDGPGRARRARGPPLRAVRVVAADAGRRAAALRPRARPGRRRRPRPPGRRSGRARPRRREQLRALGAGAAGLSWPTVAETGTSFREHAVPGPVSPAARTPAANACRTGRRPDRRRRPRGAPGGRRRRPRPRTAR